MGRILHVSVNNKIATYRQRDGVIVCGNSDYQIQFTFDSEWGGFEKKTARFVWNGRRHDEEFTGDTCNVPIIQNATEVKVGVYAGNLSTTTPAVIGCYRSILCEGATLGGESSAESDERYANAAKASADRAEAAAARAEEAADRAEGGGGIGALKWENQDGDVTVSLESGGALTFEDKGDGNIIMRIGESSGGDLYEGVYEVTPKTTGQTMETKDKLMADDVNINAIPFFEVSNTSGGKTAYIGSEV